MNRSWISVLLISALLGLLAVLATLQYQWLTQISADERERLQKRLETDTERFAEDFNRELQVAYFSFQFDAETWRQQNFFEFSERYQIWREQTAFPALIKDFYFTRNNELFRYDANLKTFNPVEWNEDLSEMRQKLQTGADFDLIDDRKFTLTMPIYEARETFIFQRNEKIHLPLKKPERFGFLVIRLDENVLKNQLLPSLAQKYFSGVDGATYKFSIVSQKDDEVVFSSNQFSSVSKNSADSSASLFNLYPDNFSVFVNRDLLTRIRSRQEPNKLIFNQITEKQELRSKTPDSNKTSVLRIESVNEPPKIFQQTEAAEKDGRWLLSAQHRDGSLENFIANTKRKNLAVSFGILTLLAASVALIFISARRAQMLAQKQLDFVSAVSHEFRTPLAVIYSASENLTDGVISTEKQISQYGNLIKREGKKLSAMVEQILEFAGARSGRKKYDMRETDVKQVIENALAECRNLIAEKGFTVETEIAENLPKISADANALSHSIQNLIINSVKYSDENKWIKISASNGERRLKIAVEDRGIGISPKDAANIFTPFYRAKAVVDAQIHGNGLGLSLVNQTVKAHGGKVLVETRLGKGSKFVIHLPLNI
jgi:signal transduction histidine kinase